MAVMRLRSAAVREEAPSFKEVMILLTAWVSTERVPVSLNSLT